MVGPYPDTLVVQPIGDCLRQTLVSLGIRQKDLRRVTHWNLIVPSRPTA